VKALLGRGRRKTVFDVKHRYSVREAKKIVLQEGLALTDGRPSWFYTAFERGDTDPLTNFALRFIEENVRKEAKVLITGCGTGIMAFHLADTGFTDIEGTDLLEKCIRVAQRLNQQHGYSGIEFRVDDGFRPSLQQGYDLITALHWVFSAWMGNYGNKPAQAAYDPVVREKLLTDFLSQYAPHLNPGGFMLVELTDAVADYRESFDHPLGAESKQIYPVRHTPEQVQRCAAAVGLEVVDKRLSVAYGHHPRTSYVLGKR
jgi:cyclopropane fatty-acyl-phospholipid synthase-like methyltransferase